MMLSKRTIQIKVKPNARASSLQEPDDDNGSWQAKLKSPPVDGKANEELVRLVAQHFNCPKSAVTIQSGASGRLKLVRIETVPPL
jgi:uncharacterized protein (TIGR00251 family)